MTKPARFALLLLLSGMIAGCNSGSTDETKKSYTYVDADEAAAAKNGQVTQDPSKVAAQGSATKGDLDKLQMVVDADKADYKAKPSDTTKKKLVDDTVDLANKTMYSEALDRKVKYRDALRLFRAAIALDPKNQTANEAANTIVSIYKSMGRPVPE